MHFFLQVGSLEITFTVSLNSSDSFVMAILSTSIDFYVRKCFGRHSFIILTAINNWRAQFYNSGSNKQFFGSISCRFQTELDPIFLTFYETKNYLRMPRFPVHEWKCFKINPTRKILKTNGKIQ